VTTLARVHAVVYEQGTVFDPSNASSPKTRLAGGDDETRGGITRRRSPSAADRAMERQRLRTVSRQPGVSQILRRLPDAVVTFDPQWRYVFMNKQAERNHGKSAREFLGRSVWDVFPEGKGLESYRRYLRAMELQEEDSYEEYLPMFGRWFEQRLFPSPDGLTVIARDVTDWQVVRGGSAGRVPPVRTIESVAAPDERQESAAENPLRIFTTFFARQDCRPELAERFRNSESLLSLLEDAGAITAELQISDDPTGPLVVTALWPNAETQARWMELELRVTLLDGIAHLVEEVCVEKYEVVRRSTPPRSR
jgi:PAS domain S-box-containing protein